MAKQRSSARPPTGSSPSFESYGGSAPENYQRYFVPSIGGPLAIDLVETAGIGPGERVLDVACGTGVVARLAAERAGPSGRVEGLDLNPGMLAVARASTPAEQGIEWHESGVDAMPFADGRFDVVTCQMGLQFFPDRGAALREMRRVLVSGGRLVLNVPGPTPELFAIMADALSRHIDPGLSKFVHAVFSIHDTAALEQLIRDAGFADVSVRATEKLLRLPPPAEFFWQYVRSTPLGASVAAAGDAERAEVERDVVARWAGLRDGESLRLQVRVLSATARK